MAPPCQDGSVSILIFSRQPEKYENILGTMNKLRVCFFGEGERLEGLCLYCIDGIMP
jgi:hypothetical protein